jgi:DNA-binding TFAR19-related protein (PDSD5 family)
VINRYNRLKARCYLGLNHFKRWKLLPNYQEKFARARVPRMRLSRQSLAPQFTKNIYHLIHQTLGLQQAPGLISGDRVFYTQVD